jgi:hypothetical protein
MGGLLTPPLPLCPNENEVPPFTPMSSVGEVGDGLTDWLLLSLLLLLPLLLVLFGAGGNFVVGRRLVVSGNIDSEFLLQVRNIVRSHK